MELTDVLLILATLLTALVAGFVLAFTVVVMPGIKTLNDRDFLKAFKVMDRVIQNNHPLFILVWAGSVLAVLASIWVAFSHLAGIERTLILIASALYLVGVQLPTATINVPLNNQLQQQDLDSQTHAELAAVRHAFEPRWVRWNAIRTVVSVATAVLLLVVLLYL